MENLLALIQRTFIIDVDIDADTPLISTGLIDSLHVAQLLILLEREYGIAIDIRDVGTDNFDTPQQISRFLTKA